jgi:raffinose/stachyose/melibiose transport system substrate-binding protein
MNDNKISRRDFLRLGMLGVGSAAIAACAPKVATQLAATSAAVVPTNTAATIETAIPTTAAASQKEISVSVWSSYSAPPQGTTTDQIIELFNKANPPIKVVHTKYEADPYETAIKTAYSGGQPPDFTEINGGTDGWQYAEAGNLVDLTDFVTPMLPNMTAAGIIDIKYQEKIWGIPFDDSIGNLVYYNKDILKSNNIEVSSLSTWSGFLAACEKLKQAGITPLAFGNKEGWPGDHWISHLMSRMYGERGFEAVNMRTVDKTIQTDLKFTDPPGVKAWQMYRELLDKGYFSSGYLSDDWPTAYKYFLDGKAAFHQTGGWFIGSALSEAPNFPLDFFIFPEVEGYPGKQANITSAGTMFVISKNSPHIEEAKKFLQYFVTEEPQRMWAENTTDLPFFKFDTSKWKLDPLTSKESILYRDAPAATKFNDHLMRQDLVTEYVWNASQGVLSGDLTPEQAADNMEKASQDAVKKLKG